MNRTLLILAITALAVTGCKKDVVCPTGQSDCDGACRELARDPGNCGACGHACGDQQVCEGGACVACAGSATGCGPTALYASCYWTGEVKPLTAGLGYGGPTLSLGTARPSRLARAGQTLLAAAGQPQASLSFAPLGGGAVSSTVQLPGSDLEGIAVTGGAALVTNAYANTVEVVALDGTILDEIPMPDQQSFPDPLGVAVFGTSAYVALNATNKVAHLDLSGLAACEAPGTACGSGGSCPAGQHCAGTTCRPPCGAVVNVIDLTAVPGAADGAALPLPSAVAAAGGKIYVSLSNLEYGHVSCDGFTYDWYAVPAGPGRLAQIDPAAADTVAIVNLGEGCKSPSDVLVHGSELWVSCGAYCFSDIAPGAIVAVDLSTGAPVVKPPIALGETVAGALAICGSSGYVTDQRKTGAVVRFDPAAATTAAPVVVCGKDIHDNALASDLLCTD